MTDDRQVALTTLHEIATHLLRIECQSQTLTSSVSLLDLVLFRGGRLPVLLGTLNGGFVAQLLASCTIRLWNRLPNNAEQARTADWLDHAGEILERVTVALLDFAQAPEADPLRRATYCALRIVDERLASLGLDLPTQLEATNNAVKILIDEIKTRRHLPSRLHARLLAALRALERAVFSIRISRVAELTGPEALPALKWLQQLDFVLLEGARRPGYFAPSCEGEDAVLVLDKVRALRERVSRTSSRVDYATSSGPTLPSPEPSTAEPPPPYVALRSLPTGNQDPPRRRLSI